MYDYIVWIFSGENIGMNPFVKLFAKTLPPETPVWQTTNECPPVVQYNGSVWVKVPPARDNDGRYLPHRIAVRRRAIEMAQGMGRDDLVSKLRDTSC